MRNIVVRTLTFFVAIPLLVALILLLPHLNHLALNVLVVIASGLGARELATLLGQRFDGYWESNAATPFLGALLPLVQVLVGFGVFHQSALQITIYAAVAVILLLQVFRRQEEGFRHTLSSAAAGTMLLLYPGLFLSYVSRMTTLSYAGPLIVTFLCMVFFNDTAAYLSGKFYRSVRERLAARAGHVWEPRVVLPVSPRKTLAGFAGGLLLSPLTLIAAHLLIPQALPAGPGELVLIGLMVGAAVIFGDLVESALKRSATRKDSGSVIPGRGGMLDSTDSILYAAPVFYYMVSVL